MSLPPEIVSFIISVLPKTTLRSTLKTLRLVCRSFYDGATPVLFNSVFVSARHIDREIAELITSVSRNSITALTPSSKCLLAHKNHSAEVSPLRRKSDSHSVKPDFPMNYTQSWDQNDESSTTVAPCRRFFQTYSFWSV